MNAVLKALLLLLASGAAIAIVLVVLVGSRGISARAKPGRIETTVARAMRQLAIPRADRDVKNAVAVTPEVISSGMAHYADHCAVCHANDGSGETQMGRGLYPKPPDMRRADTQSLTDGELFYIIENGVRLTGMPAWSTETSGGEESTWHLVHFIRQLPSLTPAQIGQMKELNPRSPEEIRQQIEEESFLKGGTEAPPASTPHVH